MEKVAERAKSSEESVGEQKSRSVTRDEIFSSNHPDYPRKQFRRAKWLSLNGPWKFAYDDSGEVTEPSKIATWTHSIEVPFAPESARSGIEDQGFHSSCWYERKFNIRKSRARVFARFGAVDYSARVWVNGRFVGSHEGGHTPFSFDITDVLSETGENTISVHAHDDPRDLAKPRGKQDWQLKPHSIWYPRTTGIWQTVWIEEVPPTYIEQVCWSPILERWEIGVEGFIAGIAPSAAQPLQLRVRLSVGKETLADDRYEVVNGEVHRRIALSDPGIDDYRNELLWSPEKPTLIDAVVELIRGDEVLDRIESYTALRGVAIQRDRFLLNNRPYLLRLVLDQGYWPESLMTPPSQDAIVRDIELTKLAGFNGVRKHQKVEDPNYLYWADVLGLLVWEEMPSAYRFTHSSVERLVKEWIEVIDRDVNHPCIVTWVPLNESWGVPDLPEKQSHRSCVQALYHITKTLDPTRPVIGNDGWEASATDILGIHDYDHDPARIVKRYGDRMTFKEVLKRSRPGGRILTLDDNPNDASPVMLTEFGGIACRDEKRHGSIETWGYSVGAGADDLCKRYQRLLDAVHRSELFAGFCYTQLTDTFQEANGLFYADRTPKFPIEKMREATVGDAGFRASEMTAPPAPYHPANT